MVMKGYSTFPRIPALLLPHHRIFSCHVQDTLWASLTPLQRSSRCILQPQSTWQISSCLSSSNDILTITLNHALHCWASFYWIVSITKATIIEGADIDQGAMNNVCLLFRLHLFYSRLQTVLFAANRLLHREAVCLGRNELFQRAIYMCVERTKLLFGGSWCRYST